MKTQNETSSFRDTAGNLFWHENIIYRGVNLNYKDNYDLLFNSGLYDELVNSKSLIPHTEVTNPTDNPEYSNFYKILKPDLIPFISYPYEWSFSQLKDAALLTLDIQKKALDKGVSLKDASAYNIQFLNGKPVFIDTLSFDKYVEDKPWAAYGQFCRHFLGPLLIAAHTDLRLMLLLKDFVDGIPLDLVAKLLPLKAKTNLLYILHIATQIKAKNYVSKESIKEKEIRISKNNLLAMLNLLSQGIKNLKLGREVTTWGDYYNITNYTTVAMTEKVNIVSTWTHEIEPRTIWDLGGNNGKFCRDINYSQGQFICIDNDVAAIEDCYQRVKTNNETNLIPLVVDLTNPTPGVGWDNKERKSLKSRGQADMSYALALIHHLAIGNNIPFRYICDYFSSLTNYLVIEFVPKGDSMVQKLLRLKEDIFTNYTVEEFEHVFADKFDILHKVNLIESDRILYLMRKK